MIQTGSAPQCLELRRIDVFCLFHLCFHRNHVASPGSGPAWESVSVTTLRFPAVRPGWVAASYIPLQKHSPEIAYGYRRRARGRYRG